MGDYSDFCESMGSTAGDIDFFDEWLQDQSEEQEAIENATFKKAAEKILTHALFQRIELAAKEYENDDFD